MSYQGVSRSLSLQSHTSAIKKTHTKKNTSPGREEGWDGLHCNLPVIFKPSVSQIILLRQLGHSVCPLKTNSLFQQFDVPSLKIFWNAFIVQYGCHHNRVTVACALSLPQCAGPHLPTLSVNSKSDLYPWMSIKPEEFVFSLDEAEDPHCRCQWSTLTVFQLNQGSSLVFSVLSEFRLCRLSVSLCCKML